MSQEVIVEIGDYVMGMLENRGGLGLGFSEVMNIATWSYQKGFYNASSAVLRGHCELPGGVIGVGCDE